MTKTTAICIFGRTQSDLARAIGVTRARIAQWPEELTRAQEDRVIGAAVRLGKWPGCHGDDVKIAGT